jgi:hypothetical protein
MTVTDISTQLRDGAMAAMAETGVTDDELARDLGTYPVAINVMRQQRDWPIDRSLRVLEALGRGVEVRVVDAR